MKKKNNKKPYEQTILTQVLFCTELEPSLFLLPYFTWSFDGEVRLAGSFSL